MILYGTKSRLISHHRISVVCDICHSEDAIAFAFQSYVHIYFIPLFPAGKTIGIECQHCKRTVRQNEMNELQKNEISRLSGKIRTPWYYWSGLAVIGLVLAFVFISENKLQNDAKKLFLDYRVNDVFVAKSSDKKFPYSVIRIVKVNDSHVRFLVSPYFYSNTDAAKNEIKNGQIFKGDYFSEMLEVSSEKFKELPVVYGVRDVRFNDESFLLKKFPALNDGV